VAPPIPGIIVVSGVPGAGKTSVSRALAGRFERAVHIEADALQRMIVTGGEWPDSSAVARGEAARQLELRGRNACLLARSFAEAGFVTFVDDIVVGTRLDEYAHALAGCDWRLIVLTPDLEVLAERNRDRGMAGDADALGQARALFEPARATPGVHLDNGAETVTETVDRIMTLLTEAR
jgi:broad-specificity NMP kinase